MLLASMMQLVACGGSLDVSEGLVVYSPNSKSMINAVILENNGKEALTLIPNTYPDIIILDINMPILNGLEVLERLPEQTYAIIILSGHSKFDYVQQAIKHGVVDYLLKPVDKNKLYKALVKAKKRVD